jgi:F-type H+-transporting ATPase subunit b
MNALLNVASVLAQHPMHSDSEGLTTPSSIWPEHYEIIFGGFSSVLIFLLLFKFAGPTIKKGMAARTEKIQKELDSAASDKAEAEAEAATIREAKGDIEAERARLLADAEAQAEALLSDGRVRLEEEIVEMRGRAVAEIEAGKNRWADELRAEISRLSSTAADRAVAESIDDATQQQLIEGFIQKVGAERVGASA